MAKKCCSTNNGSVRDKVSGVDPFLLSIGLITALVFIGVVIVGMKMGASAQVEADSRVAFTVDDFSHDWGRIQINSGTVDKTFTIENTGEATLKLYDIKTSCMCTTAQLSAGDRQSKQFGMHEKSTNVFEVRAGETASLSVEFDPAYHGPSGVGPISRTVELKTNAPDRPALRFQLTADVFNGN